MLDFLTYEEYLQACCFTGHRPDKLFGYDRNSKGNVRVLNDLREEIIYLIEVEEVSIFITGMALGIDTWAALIIIELKEIYPHIKLIGAIPCKEYYSTWEEESIKEFHYIISKCDQYFYVVDTKYTKTCLKKRNMWMVDRAKYVLAIFNNENNGGTYHCIQYAERKGRIVVTINPYTI